MVSLPNGSRRYTARVPTGLRRIYGLHHLHFITFSCYRRAAKLKESRRRDVLRRILEQVRVRYRFSVAGYVVMPEHIHLLITEPAETDPSRVLQVLKQRVARRLVPRKARSRDQQTLWENDHPAPFWQARFYDFNVFTRKKVVEKLRYMHNNPVKCGLVGSPGEWKWSSYRFYAYDEKGSVTIDPQ